MFWFFFSKRSNEGKRYIDIITIGMFIMGPNRIKFGWKTTLIAPSLVFCYMSAQDREQMNKIKTVKVIVF